MLVYSMMTENGIETINKVNQSIERLKALEPEEGYYLAFSGGKDSQCIYHLAKEAKVKFEAHYHPTTVDPPELIYFIKKEYPDVKFDKSVTTMWRLIPEKLMPPTRIARYCCEKLKEGGGTGRFVITGVRWAESDKRRKNRAAVEINAQTKKQIKLNNDNDEARRIIESCTLKSSHIINPIIDWETSDVWEYLNSRGIPHCCLYDEGFERLGCIGCPMAGKDGRQKEFERWPKVKEAYLRAFGRMIKARHEKGLMEGRTKWNTPEQVMEWWMEEKNLEEPMEGQTTIEEIENYFDY
jgi:phosphoadenosine phosphosulfate reductase